MKNIRETNRVCYTQSRPEWFSYAVLRLFYRKSKWLFVPIQDLDSDHKTKELEKASYFFVSGYGNPEIAEKAHKAGCLLVGVRADVSNSIPIIECREWDVFGAYTLIEFWRFFQLTPKIFRPSLIFLTKICSKVVWYFKFISNSIRTESLESIIIKIKKFIKIS